MTTKYHYGTAVVSSVLGVLAGILVQKSRETRDIDAEARKRGYIKPQECPPPCPPFDQIYNPTDCARCGGTWIPPTSPYGHGECIPKQSGGSGAGGTGGTTTVQPGPSGGGGPSTTFNPGGTGNGATTTQPGSQGTALVGVPL